MAGVVGVKKYPPVVVTDENNNVVGSAMLAEVWQKGLYHRVVGVFVVDDQGRMLLQLRGPEVGIFPNCWDQAVGGHVDEGFSYEQTALKETEEEIGLKDVRLEMLGTHLNHVDIDDGRTANQFERAFLVRVPHDAKFKPEEDEVSKLQWFTKEDLTQLFAEHPERFTLPFIKGLREYLPEYLPRGA